LPFKRDSFLGHPWQTKLRGSSNVQKLDIQHPRVQKCDTDADLALADSPRMAMFSAIDGTQEPHICAKFEARFQGLSWPVVNEK
jgi:hypothetical protein